MNELQLFNYEGQELRTVMIDDAPWWVAVDVAKVLDLKNIRKNLAKLDDDEKGVTIIYTLGGHQEVSIINESGLYHLIFQSRKSEAKKFRKWVTSEVLPAIRKTGSYTLNKTESPDEELSATSEIQKAQMLIRAAEHKAIPKGEQLRLLNMAVKVLTGTEINLSTTKKPKVTVSLMKLPEVICYIEKGTPRHIGCVTIELYSLLEVADILGIEPETFNMFADNHGLKNDGYCGMWERVATPDGEAREFVYRQTAIQRYKDEVNHKC